jgi:putative ABC transport system ATP-binding protein
LAVTSEEPHTASTSPLDGDGISTAGGAPTIEVVDLVKQYHTTAQEVTALNGVSWSVRAGEAFALMGPSGCGKTSLLNLLAGMDRPTSGSILVDGADLARLGERQLEEYRLRQVGYVFQFLNLIPSLTALENLELPMLVAGVSKEERQARAQALLEAVGLGEKGQKRPEQLSGGEQQRVAICLALVNDPPLILADEPTGNLDSANMEIITRMLVSLARERGKTVIVATHDPKVADSFSRVYSMRDGRFLNDE